MASWSIDYLLKKPKSKVVTADLARLFNDPRAMVCLSDDDKRRLISFLPKRIADEADPDQPSIPDEFLKYDNDWRNGHRVFQEDLAAGRYDPQWLAQAAAAMEARAHGRFDAWKAEEYESFWGQKQKMNTKVIAGSSSKLKLDVLVQQGIVRVGDSWQYSRVFAGQGKQAGLHVEKEVKVVVVSASGALDFTFPRGQNKYLSMKSGADLTVTGILGPQSLENALLAEDGRVTDPPNGNAWKVFRVNRNNQDLGTIWDMRQAFAAKAGGECSAPVALPETEVEISAETPGTKTQDMGVDTTMTSPESSLETKSVSDPRRLSKKASKTYREPILPARVSSRIRQAEARK